MGITGILAVIAMGQAAPAAADIGYDALIAGDGERAVEAIAADPLATDDPAKLINLGVAYAMEGDRDRARTMFERAAASSERYDLEVASGEWVESRRLALRALAALDRGGLASEVRTAMR
ncbi:hypothetical protein [Tsuneonella amylolytica]|uniref:hypothetical protein n=1 Tax=Tsuneonella amylolytica TaxID=2338327 RepID=UPI000EA8BA62|nr:hypothetical protein [Tsuneonella amylolytica]